jgi:hypothetical protein
MSISTYAELKTALANWSNRSDLTSRMGEFITLAESRINKDLRMAQVQKRATTDTVADQEFYPLPDDFVAAISLVLSTSPEQRLEYIPADQLTMKYPSAPSGEPEAYGIVGQSFRLVPAPNSAWTMTLSYRAKMPALSDSNTSNYVLTMYPDIYLYGGLLEIALYVKDKSAAQDWKAVYDVAVAGAKRQSFFSPSNPYVRPE